MFSTYGAAAQLSARARTWVSTIWISKFAAVVKCAFALWLLSGFLIPRTGATSLSAWRLLSRFDTMPWLFWASVAILFSTLVAFRVMRIASVAARNLIVLVGVYFALMVLPAIDEMQVSHGFGIATYELLLFPLAAGLLCSLLFSDVEDLGRVVVVLGALQASIASFLYFHGEGLLKSGHVARAGGTYGKPDAIYTIVLVCIPLALGLSLTSKYLMSRIWLTLAAVMFLALVLTWYRAPIFAAAIAMGWFCYRCRVRRNLLLSLIGVILITFLITCFVRVADPIDRRSASGSQRAHLVAWRAGLLIFEQHWSSGIGIGQLKMIVPSQSINTSYVVLEPKNLALMWLVEMGVGGGVLFVAFAIAISRIVDRSRTVLGAAVGSAWIGLLVASTFDTPFGVADRPYGNALLGVLLGLTIRAAELQSRDIGIMIKPNTSIDQNSYARLN